MDEVVCDHAESDPAPDAVGSLVAGSLQAVAPFQHTDAALTAGAPFLQLLEPALFLPLFPGRTLGGVAGNRHLTASQKACLALPSYPYWKKKRGNDKLRALEARFPSLRKKLRKLTRVKPARRRPKLQALTGNISPMPRN
jgi:hypothetical protein